MTEVIKELIENLVEASLEEVLRGFNFNMFKNIAANDQRPKNKQEEEDFVWGHKKHPEIAYALKHLPELGVGSSRHVFALSSSKVLKIAMNHWGFAQNKAEVELFTHNRDTELVTKIFDFSPDFKWIVSEIVNPLAKGEFTKLIGFDEDWLKPIMLRYATFEDLQEAAKAPMQNSYGDERTEVIQQILASPGPTKFLKDLYRMMETHGLGRADIVPEHFGKTVDGKIRLYDYGYNKEVMKLYRQT